MVYKFSYNFNTNEYSGISESMNNISNGMGYAVNVKNGNPAINEYWVDVPKYNAFNFGGGSVLRTTHPFVSKFIVDVLPMYLRGKKLERILNG